MKDYEKREMEYEAREDVDRLLRADEVKSDTKRYSRAMARLEGTLQRLGKKKSRHNGRSSRR